MTGPRRITIRWGPVDDGYKEYQGVLFEGSYAMHADLDDRELWIDRVVPVGGYTDVYTNMHPDGAGMVLTENTYGGDEKFLQIYAMLKGMSAFEFVTNVLMQEYVHVEIFPAR